MSHGILIVDKPAGLTSHDVVARLRRALGTRRVGHAGTLDPMATGVLVALVGEGTKLGPYLTAHDKRYLARVTFGLSTETLDAEGAPVARAEVPERLWRDLEAISATGGGGALGEALAAELARTEQVPPTYSAIHVDGQRSYDRARAGEAVPLAPRAVRALACTVVATGRDGDLAWLDVDLHVGKGYYVRSFARDVGAALGVPAHLAALRRLASGPYTIERALRLDAPPAALVAAVVPLATAATEALSRAVLCDDGATRARQGKRLGEQDFTEPPPRGESAAWLDASGRLVAIGERVPGEAPATTEADELAGSSGAGGEPREPSDVMIVRRGFGG
jgi:tRNA pseudouridine55 synthase